MEEREAFREFYLKYAKKLYRVVERLQEIQEGKVGDITEDVVQESFLLAFVKWDEIRKSDKPMGLLVEC